MPEMDDIGLLREYAVRRSEEAFSTLVARYVNLVYSAALRQVGHHQQAEEITQAVFLILARKAGSLRSGTILPAWLFQTTRLTAANFVRSELRRARREQEACMQSNVEDHSDDAAWQQLAPFLNDAIAGLGTKDRDAIILRYLDGKGYREVAAALGSTEENARMRVSRALEKLRNILSKRGVVLSATALAGLLTAHATQAAPAGFAASIAAAAAEGTRLAASTVALGQGTVNLMTWITAQIVVGTSVVILIAFQQYQNVADGRQLAEARGTLRDTRQALLVQSNRVAELQEQTAAILDTRRSQELELQALRARRGAAANGSGAAGANGPTTLLSAALRDPDAWAAFRDEMRGNYAMRYWRFLETNNVVENVHKAQLRKLIEPFTDYAMTNLESVAAVTEGRMTAEAAVQLDEQGKQAVLSQIRQALGDAKFAEFEEYDGNWAAEEVIRNFETLCERAFKLDPDQLARFSEVVHSLPVEIVGGRSAEFPVSVLVHPERLNDWFEQQAAINREILRRSSEFLTPDQLEALELTQKSTMSAMKRNALRLLRKI